MIKTCRSIMRPKSEPGGNFGVPTSAYRSLLWPWGPLLLAQSFLFLPAVHCFLQGDALFWISHRNTSWREFFVGFAQLDAHQWYRPLSHGFSGSLLFPFFGLEAAAYHFCSLALLILTGMVAWRVFLRLSSSYLAAVTALFYFGIHSSHGFTTFGAAFDPDLLGGLFWTATVWFFLLHLDTGQFRHLTLAVGTFTLGLLSKETVLALPLTLLLLSLLHSGFRRAQAVRALIPMAIVSTLYLLGVGFLLRDGDLLSGTLRSHYSISAGSNLLHNSLQLGAWAFNLPAGWHTHWRDLGPAGELLLWGLTASIFSCWVLSLWRSEKSVKPLWVGWAWYASALIPALFLHEVKPYYLFAALPGFALAVGEAAEALRRRIRGEWEIRILLAASGTAFLFLNWLSIEADRQAHPLLGRSAEINARSLSEVRRTVNGLGSGAVLVILNPEGDSPLWHYADGDLFRLAFRDPGLPVLFPYYGDTVPLEQKPLYAFLFQDLSLTDITSQFLADPERYLSREDRFQYRTAEPGLIRVTPSRVAQGEGGYTIQIPRFSGERVEIQYRIDNSSIGIFSAALSSRGEVGFFVSHETRPGQYRFIAVRPEGTALWWRGDPAHLRVEER